MPLRTVWSGIFHDRISIVCGSLRGPDCRQRRAVPRSGPPGGRGTKGFQYLKSVLELVIQNGYETYPNWADLLASANIDHGDNEAR